MASVAHQHVLQHPSTAAACAEQTQEAAHHDVQVLHRAYAALNSLESVGGMQGGTWGPPTRVSSVS